MIQGENDASREIQAGEVIDCGPCPEVLANPQGPPRTAPHDGAIDRQPGDEKVSELSCASR